MKRILMIFVVCCMVLPNAVHADMIIDTGQPPDEMGGHSLFWDQWLAGEFTLTEAYTITDVLGWMYNGEGSGDVKVVIYGDGGDVPDGSVLYSYTSDLSLVLPAGHNDWAGAQGVSWYLEAGTYWAAFEIPESDVEYGMPSPAPSPLANYAYTSYGTWYNEHTNFGIRISGEPVVVPVPAAFILGIIGLGSAGLGLRRRNVNQVS